MNDSNFVSDNEKRESLGFETNKNNQQKMK